MTPFSNVNTDRERRYNIAHKKTRHLVECCIGILKSRFRCINRQNVLMYSSAKSGTIINTCVILHNVMVAEGYPLPPSEEINSNIDRSNHSAVNEEISQTQILRIGQSVRNSLLSSF